jgi:iron complex transport system ATP-binding protein
VSDSADWGDTLRLAAAGVGFGDRWALRGASLSVRRGRLTALVGPNGSGKSTALRLLAGLWSPTEGQTLLSDRPIDRYDRKTLAKRIAWVPQSASLSYAFTVREVVAMGRFPHSGRLSRPGPADEEAIERAMLQTDTAALADRWVTQLSGGEVQRVLIARCLATEADFLILDEPTSHLDMAHALEVLSICRRLAHQDGRGVCLAIHDLSAVMRQADEAVCLSFGRVVADGPPAEVLTPERIQAVFCVHAEPVTSSRGPALVFHRLSHEQRTSGL